jgi:hypothetical protein
MGGALSKYDRQTQKVSVFTVPQINAIVYGVGMSRSMLEFAGGSGDIIPLRSS